MRANLGDGAGCEVTVQPGDLVIRVRRGESLAESAWRQGYRWPTTCWGQAECMVCAVRVVGGEAAAVPADEAELEAIRYRMSRSLQHPQTRLACRLEVRGTGVVVEKKGVRAPETRSVPAPGAT